MKLHDNQLRLIRHLIRFNILDYENCLKVLSTQNEKDEIALSYAFRPLTKNNYIAKNKDNIVTVLNKGKNLFPDEKQLISDGGNEQTRKRILQVSKRQHSWKTAVLLSREDCPIIGNRHSYPQPVGVTLHMGYYLQLALQECWSVTVKNTLFMI